MPSLQRGASGGTSTLGVRGRGAVPGQRTEELRFVHPGSRATARVRREGTGGLAAAAAVDSGGDSFFQKGAFAPRTGEQLARAAG